jgi:plasmid stabilization system protein ParE
MKSYKVLITEKAEKDIIDIRNYISNELHEPETAKRVVSIFHDTIIGLSNMPFRFSHVSDNILAAKGIRLIVIDNYIVFFIIHEKDSTVGVLRILYNRRDWINLL